MKLRWGVVGFVASFLSFALRSTADSWIGCRKKVGLLWASASEVVDVVSNVRWKAEKEI